MQFSCTFMAVKRQEMNRKKEFMLTLSVDFPFPVKADCLGALI